MDVGCPVFDRWGSSCYRPTALMQVTAQLMVKLKAQKKQWTKSTKTHTKMKLQITAAVTAMLIIDAF